MRLVQMKLSNFRCYKNETVVDLDELTVFIGRNDAGKSSLLDALDIFFDDKATPEADDKPVGSGDKTIRITCIFDDLPTKLIVDDQRPTSLAQEHLLNSDGKLEILKTFTYPGSGKPKPSGTYAVAVHPTQERYDNLLTLNNKELKQLAKDLSIDLANTNQTANTELRQAIWGNASNLDCKLKEVPLSDDAAGKIWDQLKKLLPVFALFKSDRASTDQDAEAQDPMKAAIKEAIRAQQNELDSVAARIRSEVQEIANRTVAKISEMNPELAKQLTPRVNNKNWDTLFSVSLTGDDDIPINKRGSGTRRLILLNFFRAKAEKDAETKDCGVIYAIEEPETSQHPHNQLMLVEAFQDLAERYGCQVILTTHTPMLARRFDRRSLRLVSKLDNVSQIQSGTQDYVLEEIRESLGVLPDHGIKAFFGVEGKHDINFMTTISEMLNRAGESVPDLGEAEQKGNLVIVPLGGSNLELWIARLKHLNIPEFYLMDRDNVPPKQPKYAAQAEAFNKQSNCTAWTTSKRELENYIHKDVILDSYPDYTGTGGDFEDVPLLFAQAVHEVSDSGNSWEDVIDDHEKKGKKVSTAKKRLNSEFVGRMTPELLSRIDPNNDVRTWLTEIGKALER